MNNDLIKVLADFYNEDPEGYDLRGVSPAVRATEFMSALMEDLLDDDSYEGLLGNILGALTPREVDPETLGILFIR